LFRTPRPARHRPRLEELEQRLPPGDAVLGGLLGWFLLESGVDAFNLAPPQTSRPATFPSGSSLSDVLAGHKLTPADAEALAGAPRPQEETTTLSSGSTIAGWGDPPPPFAAVRAVSASAFAGLAVIQPTTSALTAPPASRAPTSALLMTGSIS